MLMKALQFSHPRADQLDLSFEVQGAGATKLDGSGAGRPQRELLKVSVDECECVLKLTLRFVFPSMLHLIRLLQCAVLILDSAWCVLTHTDSDKHKLILEQMKTSQQCSVLLVS